MNKFIPFVVAATMAIQAHAQVAVKIWADPSELKALSKKTLVVELPDENSGVINSFPKKTAEADIAAYRASLASYREKIEPAVREHWRYNEKIEFKTTSEIVSLFAKKSSKYVVLLKVVLPDGGGAYAYTFGLGVPALVLTRTDGDHKVTKKGQLQLAKYDYQMYLCTDTDDDGREIYTDAGLAFTLKQAQKHLQWAARQKKSEHYIHYCKAMRSKNCSKLRSKQLVLEESSLHKDKNKSDAMEAYGSNIEFVPRSELDAIYTSGTSDKAVLYSFPVGTIKGNALVVTITKLVYMKVVVDPSTDEVLHAIVPGMGQTYVEGLTMQDLKNLGDCK